MKLNRYHCPPRSVQRQDIFKVTQLCLVFSSLLYSFLASQVALVVKNPPANGGDARDASSIPGPGRSPGEGSGNPLQYSFLENPRVRGTWRAIVHGVTKSQTRLSD